MRKTYKVLMIEDNDGDIRLIRELLNDYPAIHFDLTVAGSLSEGIKIALSGSYEVFLLDLGLPDSNGLDTFLKLKDAIDALPGVIILTGLNDDEIGMDAVLNGAQDYLVKGQIDSYTLAKSIVYAYERTLLNIELSAELLARKKAEQKKIAINRLLQVLSNVNQAIVRKREIKELIAEVCTIMVETGGFLFCGFSFDADSGYEGVYKYSGGYFSGNKILNKVLQETFEQAKRLRSEIILDGFREKISHTKIAEDFRLKACSLGVFPLFSKDRIFGSMALVSEKDAYFKDRELNIMQDIAEDLSYAFTIIEQEESKKRIEKELGNTRKVLEALYSLSKKTDLPEQKLVQLALEEAEKLTESRIGYLHFINNDQVTLKLFTWSAGTLRTCTAVAEEMYKMEDAGIWAEPVRTGKPAIHNYYKNHPAKAGLPEGHIELSRHLSVAVFDHGKAVLVAGVGNKRKPYTKSDAKHLQLLMNEMWKIITRNRAIEETNIIQQKLNKISDHTGAVMYQLNRDGSGYDYIHPAIKKLSGLSAGEVMKSGLFKIIRKVEKPGSITESSISIKQNWINKTKSEWNFDYLIETSSGELKWINDQSYPVFDDNGDCIGSSGLLKDISLQKEAETEVLLQNQKVEQLFSNSPLAIVQVDTNDQILLANDSFIQLFGYDIIEIIGKDINELILSPEYEEDAVEMFRETSRGGGIKRLRKRFKKDGTIIDVSIASVPIKITGELVGIYVMYTDLSKEREAERAMLKERLLLRTVLDNIPDAIYVKDTEGRKVMANKADLINIGKSESEVIGRTDPELFADKDAEIRYRDDLEVVEKGKEILNREEHISSNGRTTKWLLTSKIPLRGPARDITGLVGIGRDITEIKESQEKLNAYKEHLEELVCERTLAFEEAKIAAESANKAKSEFLANMSHEIRTPLNAIFGFSELLTASLTDERQKSQIGSILKSARNLLDLINDILDLSKIEAGRMTIHKSPVNLQRIISDVESIFTQKIEEKSLKFHIETKGTVPDALLFDEIRLRQVLFNLMGNAVKFTDRGAITLMIENRTKNPDSKWVNLVISVSDTGIGIPPDQQKLIFDPFIQQEGQNSQKYGGTGLGLAITRRLVEIMGGSISVSSVSGKGSTFSLALPKVKKSSRKEKVVVPKTFDPKKIIFDPGAILIADDNPVNRKLIVDALSFSPLRIVEAENGKMAVDLAEKDPFNLILMDIKMPVLDGIKASRKIRKMPQHQKTPIIALTATRNMNEGSTRGDFLFENYLIKPLNLMRLVDVIGNYMKHKVNGTGAKDAEAHKFEINPGLKLTVPRELAGILQTECTKECHEALNDHLIDQIENLGNRLTILATEYEVSEIQSMGEEIIRLAENFEIDKLIPLMNQLPEIFSNINISETTYTDAG